MAQTSQVSLGHARYVWSGKFTEADNGSTVAAIDVPANTWIPPYGVTVYIAEVFAGGTPSMNVGDGGTTNGWVPTADITEATVGCYTGSAGDYSDEGRMYLTADTIDVIIDDTTLTGGTGYIIVKMLDVSGLDIAAS